jgi:hypothetical protein
MRISNDVVRRRFSAKDRRKFLARWRRSQQTQREFARQCGLKLTTFRQWLYRTKQPKAGGRRVAFQEMTNAAPLWAPGPTVEIAVGPEITLRLNGTREPEFIAQLIHHLRRPC